MEEVRAEQETQEPKGALEAEPRRLRFSTLLSIPWQARIHPGPPPSTVLPGLSASSVSGSWLQSEGQPAKKEEADQGFEGEFISLVGSCSVDKFIFLRQACPLAISLDGLSIHSFICSAPYWAHGSRGCLRDGSSDSSASVPRSEWRMLASGEGD